MQSDMRDNYCRNPSSGDDGLWCFTTNPEKRWDYCDPIACTEDWGASPTGANYRGCKTTTHSGTICRSWSSHAAAAANTTQREFPSAGLVGNYCRNPDGRATTWCYTIDENLLWDYCTKVPPPEAATTTELPIAQEAPQVPKVVVAARRVKVAASAANATKQPSKNATKHAVKTDLAKHLHESHLDMLKARALHLSNLLKSHAQHLYDTVSETIGYPAVVAIGLLIAVVMIALLAGIARMIFAKCFGAAKGP